MENFLIVIFDQYVQKFYKFVSGLWPAVFNRDDFFYPFLELCLAFIMEIFLDLTRMDCLASIGNELVLRGMDYGIIDTVMQSRQFFELPVPSVHFPLDGRRL
jgi:hypothetical protein